MTRRIMVLGLAVAIAVLVLAGVTPERAQASPLSAFQTFEGGYMIWYGETGEIWVLTFADWQTHFFPQSMYENLPDNPVTEDAPLDFVKPVSGFGRVWGNFPSIRQALGWGLVEEFNYPAIFLPASITAGGLSQTMVNTPDGRQLVLRGDQTWGYYDGRPRSIWSLSRPVVIPSTIQMFEYGFMMWWSETGSIWVLNASTREAIHFASTDYGALSDNPVTTSPPAGLIKPIMGFGKVWGHFPAVRQSLGWAISPSRSYLLNFVRHPSDGTFACELSHPDLGTFSITGNSWLGGGTP